MTANERGGNLAYLMQLREGLVWYRANTPMNDTEQRQAEDAYNAVTAMCATTFYGGEFIRKPKRCLLVDLTTQARDDNITRFSQALGVTRQAVDHAINHGREVGARSAGVRVVGFYDLAQRAWVFNISDGVAITLNEDQLPMLYGVGSHREFLSRLGQNIPPQ